MNADSRIDLPDSPMRRERLAELKDYPAGVDRIVRVGRRYPVEIETLRLHDFPFAVCFSPAIVVEARRCLTDRARITLSFEATRNGRTRYVTAIERV